MNEFLKLFGDITVSNIVTFLIACAFLIGVYIKVKKYLIDKYEIEKSKDDKIKEICEAVKEIPELKKMQQNNAERLNKIEEENRERECNRLRDIILQNYRHYTNVNTNPSQSWTQMEHDSFFALIKDYEKLNGNGFVHSIVIPAMENLRIVELE
jgi:hypothetical protein